MRLVQEPGAAGIVRIDGEMLTENAGEPASILGGRISLGLAVGREQVVRGEEVRRPLKGIVDVGAVLVAPE